MKLDGWRAEYTGKAEGSSRTACVGIWEPISERFITVRFRSRNISIIHTEKIDFYIELSTIYDNTPREDIIIIFERGSWATRLYAEPCHGNPRHRCA